MNDKQKQALREVLEARIETSNKAIEIIEFSPTFHKHQDGAALCHCEICAYIRGNVTEIRVSIADLTAQLSALEPKGGKS